MQESTQVDLAPWERSPLLPNGARDLASALDAVADQIPDEIAVDDGEHRVTFSELASRARRIANAVVDRHDDAATPVVALCSHGVDPVTGVLGVVSSGHMVSPLDGRDPADRLAQIIRASGASMILAEAEFGELARHVAPDCAVLMLDEALAYPDTTPKPAIDDNTPGLIVFTSGSTGTPKGVVQRHRQLLGKGLARSFGGNVVAGDRVMLSSSFSYSASYGRIFRAVTSGAGLFTYDTRVLGQRAFPDWVNANEITTLSFMTPLLRALVDAPNVSPMLAVRTVQVGGDSTFGIDIARARRLFGPDVEFTAGFASTETGGVCSYRVTPEDEAENRPIPLGPVEPWSEIRVVDPDTDDPVPDGEPGRLQVHNHLLALGYWRDPELTARHFFTEPDGRRWFGSNDLVSVRADGVVEHHGRIDFRVKVRGALVGLGEVERAVLATTGVAQCVVVGDELPEGGHRLIAYVVPERGMTPSARELRRDVSTRLPTTMMPSAIVLLDELPSGATGKVDRKALPAPPPPETRPYREPKGHDRELAEVFAEILAVEHVGLDDDFFDLGGDSLGVVELVAAIQERFGVDVVASTVLDAPTVAELAPKLTHRRRHETSVVVPLSTEGARMPFFCATGGGAPALSLRALADALASTTAANGTTRPFYGMQPRGLEERAFPDHSVVAAATRNLRAIREVHPHGPFLLGGYSYGATVAFEMACLLEAAGERVPLLVILDATAPGTRNVTRAKRLRRRGAALTAEAPPGVLQRSATVGLRTARFAAKSAGAHAERRISLTSAGLFPRRGLDQYELFLRLNGRMAREYRRSRDFGGPVLVVRSEAPPGGGTPPEDFGWSACVTGPISMIDAPGDHLAMIRKPAVTTLAARLADELGDFS
jgi:acyl-coenzyme A synthetase/AMP-(fatty) acid ligase/thioesterase domain-containing protein/acyl carrier protein